MLSRSYSVENTEVSGIPKRFERRRTAGTVGDSVVQIVVAEVGETAGVERDAGARSERALGEPGADLAKVMVASQQSQVAFRATVEVRNRLVQAYQDVMNMPL